MIEIGLALKRAKATLGHGQFGSLLKAEFSWDDRAARRFMQIADRYEANRAKSPDLSFETLVVLTSRSTPDEVREAIEERVAAGELVTAADVNRLRDEAKAKGDEAQRAAARAQVSTMLRNWLSHWPRICRCYWNVRQNL